MIWNHYNAPADIFVEIKKRRFHSISIDILSLLVEKEGIGVEKYNSEICVFRAKGPIILYGPA